MSVQNPAQRHHYIPQFYLSRWVDGNGQLVEFSKPYQNLVRAKKIYTKQGGWENKLYALEGLRDDVAQMVEERFFRPVDTRAADVLTAMEKGKIDLSGKDRVAWGQFLLSFQLRSPEHVRSIISRMHQLMENPSRDDERRWRKQRRLGSPMTMREALLDPDNRARSQRKALEVMMEVSGSDKLGTAITSMIWGSRLMPYHVPALLTSDRPLQWFGQLNNPDCQIILPIGPKRIFWAVASQHMSLQIQTTPSLELVSFLNNHIIRRAKNFVYAKTEAHLGEVQAKMGVDPEYQNLDRLLK